MTIRICQFITELRPAGAERCVYALAARLPAERFTVEVAALRGGPVADALRAAGATVHVLGAAGKLDVSVWPKAARLLRRGRFDILHTHLFHADFVSRTAAVAAGIPHAVHTVHVAERRFRPWQFAWTHLTAGGLDRIVCVSEGVRDFHAARTHLSPDTYTVIHNGIDADRMTRSDTLRRRFREQWGLKTSDILCAFVGRLDRQKGIDVLLDGFQRAAADNPDLHLVLAGDGPLRRRVSDWLERSPAGSRARALGFIGDVTPVLSAADIFCQPSRWEGFCLAAAAAMAAGLPVAGSDVAGLNEVVADGRTGLLRPPGDAEAFADALTRLAADAAVRADMGDAGRRRVLERFALDRFCDDHARLYESLVSDTGPDR